MPWGSSTRTSPGSAPPPTSWRWPASTWPCAGSGPAGSACARSTPRRAPSFSLNAELGFYYCFGCGAKGDVITFVREIEHLDFVEAVEKLAARAGITLRYDDQATGRDHQRRARIHETLEQAVAWYHQRLLLGARCRRGPVATCVASGATTATWCASTSSAGRPKDGTSWSASLGVPQRGAGRRRPGHRRRIGPVHRLLPGPAALSRSSSRRAGRSAPAAGSCPAAAAPSTRTRPATAVYDKSRVLYGLNWAKKAVVDAGRVVVCEGYTDVIGLQRAGVGEAVATCGTALADGHIRLLTNFARRIVLAYDADAAGQAAAERYYEWERRFEVDIRVAALPAGRRPRRPGPTRSRRRWPAAVAEARPYLGFRLDRLFGRADLSTPEGRARAAADGHGAGGRAPQRTGPRPVPDAGGRPLPGRAGPAPPGCRWPAGNGPVARRAAAGPTPWPHGRRAAEPGRRGGVPADPMPSRGGRPGARGPAPGGAPPRGGRRPAGAVLFAHPLARAGFEALSAATTLHEAIEAADPQAADLLQRLAVEDTDAEADDVMVRLVERAGQRALPSCRPRCARPSPADQAGFVPTVSWLKLTLETLRAEDAGGRPAALEAEQRLVAWLVARDRGGAPDGGDR